MLEMMTSSILKKITEPGLEIDPEVFQKIMASDGSAGDNFGYSISISGDSSTIVVGACFDDDKGTDSGSVYVFSKQPNGVYLQIQKLLAADGAAGDAFGTSVTVSGDGSIIVIGAKGDDDKGSNSGSVYVFKKQANGTYLQSQKLLAADGTANDSFGVSLAISPDSSVIVIGADQGDGKNLSSGTIYIFTRQLDGNYLQTQELLTLDSESNDSFGYAVSISEDGSTVISGAYWDDDKGNDSGSVYVFTKQPNGSYLQTQKLIASDGAANNYFGYSVDISGDGSVIIVGAWLNNNNQGSAYIFTKQANGTYLQTQKLIAADGATNDRFGIDVGITSDGLSIAVGAYNDANTFNSSGSVYIFTKEINGTYVQDKKLVPDNLVGLDFFGYKVAFSNSSLLVGAFNHLNKGAAFVY